MKRAFSLIEILAVIAIVAILIALTIPAVKSLGRASSLSSAIQEVSGILDLARQDAIAQNRTFEVRFYKLPEDGKTTATPADYRGIQVFLVDYDVMQPATKPEKLTAPAIISNNAAVSSLMDDTIFPEQSAPAGVAVSTVGQNYRFRSFRFKPDGSTNLPRDKEWTLTLINKTDPIKSGNLPANFATIRLEPMTGRVKVDRP